MLLQPHSAPSPTVPTERPLDIALVTETWPPEVNGVALSLARLAAGLHQRGHRLRLVRPRRTREDRAQVEPGFAELLVPGLPIPRYPELRMGLPVRARLERLWRAQRPDLVHIATEGPLGWSALRAACALDLPVCAEFRTNFHAYSSHYGIGWLRGTILRYLRWFHNRCDVTMVPTQAMCRDLAAEGFERLRVVARGVDTQRFDPRRRSAELRESWGAGPGDIVVLYVGRLAAEKNLDGLVEAWHAMQQGRAAQAPRLRLVLVGDGPLRDALPARLPGALFAGQRTGEDLARHYASGDLFLFPSLTETFGNVVPEALASGLPVVAFDMAAAAELLREGENGLRAPVANRAAFVAAARAAVADADALRRMGEAARRDALALDWDAVVRLAEDTMGVACAQSARGAHAHQPGRGPIRGWLRQVSGRRS